MLGRPDHIMKASFLLILLCLSFYTSISVDVATTQLSSLIELRNSLDKNLTVLSSWKESKDCSEWLGVKCDAKGLVTEITLRSLNNYLPDYNFAGNNVTNATLANDQLNGFIPDSIGNLTTLERLTISGNILARGIPSSIGNLTNLEILDLSYNFLKGTIPSSIGNLTKLRYLFLSFNSLTGNIPKEFGNLVNVISFDVSVNYLNGSVPDSLSNLENLVLFLVGVNDYAPGPIPSWISNFVNLTHLDYHGANANGPFPPIANLTKLQIIDLSFNKLTGSISSRLSKSKDLVSLILSSNLLNGTIPEFIGQLPLLTLDVSINRFSGPIPSINYGDTIFLLDFTSNSFNGSIPPSISKTTSLKALSLADNKLTGSIPVELTEMTNLLDLSLTDNSLTGQIPSEIGNLFMLSNLFLSNNQFSGPLPNNISLMKDLITLFVDNNTFTGQIPPEFGSLYSLEVFDASNNIFTGIIPPSFKDLNNVTNLRLFQNSLQGPIPDFSGLADLVELDLSLNSLSGPLPNNLNPSLIKLNLRSNRLSGPVPSNFIQRLTNLTTLDLSVNQLTNVPTFKNVPNSFEYISLASNQFGSSTKDITRSDGKIIQIFGNDCAITNTSCFKKYSDYNPGSKLCNVQTCYGLEVVNPVTYSNADSCSCSPPLITQIKLYAPLFYIFNGNESRNVEKAFAAATGLTESQVQVVNATAVVTNQVTFDVFILFFTNEGGEWTVRDSNEIIRALFGGQSKYDIEYARVGPYKVLNYLKASKGSPSDSVDGEKSKAKDNGVATWILALVSCLAALVVVAVIVVAVVFVRVYGGKGRKLTDLEEEVMKGMARAIDLSEIQQATKFFSEDLLLGAGGFGSVYKGVSKNGHLWAVKRAKKVSLQSKSEFENEVLSISKMDHINLVKLLGYCGTQTEQILIYEFMPKGTLRNALDPTRAGVTRPVLTLDERIHIAVGSAAGLSYLHNGATQTIIHRDIKSENILLDGALTAKVADFGLLKKNDSEELENTENTKLAGTPGYMDPEYYTTYKVTTKSDVYSFGVVLLELLTGKAPIMEDLTTIRSKFDQDAVSMITVTKWAVPHIEMGKISDIMDPLLENNYDPRAAEALSHVAFACVRRQGKDRPDMTIVVARLREILEALRTGGEITTGHFSVVASETDSTILDPPLPSVHESGVSGFYAPSDISFGR